MRFLLVLTTALLLTPGLARATSFDLAATIDCAQANAGAGTCGAGGSGTGSATLTYDDVSNLLSWDISWSGLSGDETIMHFHGPAQPDQNAGIQVNFGAISGIVSPSIGATNITDTQEAQLLSELWYVNIHTSTFAGGEIRGQVLLVPEPASLALVALGLAAAAAWGRRPATA